MKLRIDTDRFRVGPRTRLSLGRHDPADTFPFATRKEVKGLLEKSARRLYDLTELLYAQNRWSLLLVFQAMDGAGKDSAINHVMQGLDPKTTQVSTFGPPSSEELDHDFLWRCLKLLHRAAASASSAARTEDVLRASTKLLRRRNVPVAHANNGLWQERFDDIRNVEQYLGRNAR